MFLDLLFHAAQAQGNFKVVQGRTISMPCYDPSVASQSSDHFVAVTFSPLSGGPDVKVCDYKVWLVLCRKKHVSRSFNVFIGLMLFAKS